MTVLAHRRVAPFGHLGINACVPLPRAYRSLPRPSSPPCAQAFPTCLHSLDSKSVKPDTRDLRVSNSESELRHYGVFSGTRPSMRFSECCFHNHVVRQLSNSGFRAAEAARNHMQETG